MLTAERMDSQSLTTCDMSFLISPNSPRTNCTSDRSLSVSSLVSMFGAGAGDTKSKPIGLLAKSKYTYSHQHKHNQTFGSESPLQHEMSGGFLPFGFDVV